MSADDGYDGFAGGPVGDDFAVALVCWPWWAVRWCWRKVVAAVPSLEREPEDG